MPLERCDPYAGVLGIELRLDLRFVVAARIARQCHVLRFALRLGGRAILHHSLALGPLLIQEVDACREVVASASRAVTRLTQ